MSNVPLCPPGSPQCSVLTTHQSASLSRPDQAGAGAGAGTREIKARLQSTRRFISLNNPAPTLESCMQLLALCTGVTMPMQWHLDTAWPIRQYFSCTRRCSWRLHGSRGQPGDGTVQGALCCALCLAQTLAKFYQLSDLMTRIPIKILSHARASKLNICFEFEINISIHLNTQ